MGGGVSGVGEGRGSDEAKAAGSAATRAPGSSIDDDVGVVEDVWLRLIDDSDAVLTALFHSEDALKMVCVVGRRAVDGRVNTRRSQLHSEIVGTDVGFGIAEDVFGIQAEIAGSIWRSGNICDH